MSVEPKVEALERAKEPSVNPPTSQVAAAKTIRPEPRAKRRIDASWVCLEDGRKCTAIDYRYFPLERTLQLVLASGFLAEVRPLSMLVAATPESGKTYAMERFKGETNCISFDLASKYGIISDLHVVLGRGQFVSHVFIPDFTALLYSNANVASEVKAFINTVTDKGLERQSSFYSRFDYRQYRELLPWGYLKLGFVCAMTQDDLKDKRRNFANAGFLSRFIPFSYSLSESRRLAMRDNIIREVPALPAPIVSSILKMRSEVRFSPEAYLESRLAKVVTPRWTEQMRTLLKACALTHGRDHVTAADFAEAEHLSHYFNMRYNLISTTPWTEANPADDRLPWDDDTVAVGEGE